jgi:hypothetical protein
LQDSRRGIPQPVRFRQSARHGILCLQTPFSAPAIIIIIGDCHNRPEISKSISSSLL